MTTRQSVQHAGEISLGVETVELCSLDDRIQDCRAVAAAIGTEEQKILARDSDAPQQSLRQIVVDAEPAVVDIAGQGIPAAQPILQCFAQRRFAGQPSSLSDRPDMVCIEQWLAARLPLRPTLVGGSALDVGFDGIEFLD